VKTFFKDPKNLRYSLNTIIPVLVFLSSILVAVTTERFRADSEGYIWIISVSLFVSICSLFVILGITQPLKELLARAEQVVRFKGKKSEKGQMIEVYQLIEGLIELVKSDKTGKSQSTATSIENIERLDYLLPLGYMSLMVAHEVRNPLSTITGISELLKQKESNQENIVYINAILDAAHKIDVFTKELLDFTENEVHKNTIDINEIVEEAIKAVSANFKEVTFEFKKGEPIMFEGDSDKLSQAILNIIKNAFEHEKAITSKSQTIIPKPSQIATEKDKQTASVIVKTDYGDPITISVFNRNSSIDEKDFESIFKPFFSKKKGGRGLGLFIAMRNVRIHGGDIKIESGEDGTRFVVQMPRSEGQKVGKDRGLEGWKVGGLAKNKRN